MPVVAHAIPNYKITTQILFVEKVYIKNRRIMTIKNVCIYSNLAVPKGKNIIVPYQLYIPFMKFFNIFKISANFDFPEKYKKKL